MIQKIIEYINTGISDLNSFAVVNGLCEYITKPVQEGDDLKFPALYKSGDQLAQVTNFDFRSGVVFHVKNGDTSIEPVESARANKECLRYSSPMRCIAIVKRSITGNDNNYSHEQLANNLVHVIENVNINSLKSELLLSKIDSLATSYSTDSENIEQVFINVPVKFRHDLSIVFVNYNIVTVGYKDCFINYTC